MVLPLTQLRCAKIIQSFYKTYIKAYRDKQSGLPIDPISHDTIPKERQLKLFITTNGTNRSIQYFDIYNLNTWFNTRQELVNPLTNLGFTRNQIADIRNCYIRIGLPLPNILHPDYVSPVEDDEDDIEVEEVENQNHNLEEYLITICSNPMSIDEIRYILYTNVHNIDNDTFNLNKIQIINHDLVNSVTALMNAVLHDNLLAVQELLYFNPDLNISDSMYGYKAVDLAIISNGANSLDILHHLLFHGARLDIATNNGPSYELTTDLSKLEIIYNFSN
jgi:hypothetical protein